MRLSQLKGLLPVLFCWIPKIKNRSRIHYLMANIEVGQVAGEDNWVLLLDDDGHIAEGMVETIFL